MHLELSEDELPYKLLNGFNNRFYMWSLSKQQPALNLNPKKQKTDCQKLKIL